MGIELRLKGIFSLFSSVFLKGVEAMALVRARVILVSIDGVHGNPILLFPFVFVFFFASISISFSQVNSSSRLPLKLVRCWSKRVSERVCRVRSSFDFLPLLFAL